MTAWKKTIGVAFSPDEIALLDAKVAMLAKRDIALCGRTTVNRSSIIRYALAQLNWDAIPACGEDGSVEGLALANVGHGKRLWHTQNVRESAQVTPSPSPQEEAADASSRDTKHSVRVGVGRHPWRRS